MAGLDRQPAAVAPWGLNLALQAATGHETAGRRRAVLSRAQALFIAGFEQEGDHMAMAFGREL